MGGPDSNLSLAFSGVLVRVHSSVGSECSESQSQCGPQGPLVICFSTATAHHFRRQLPSDRFHRQLTHHCSQQPHTLPTSKWQTFEMSQPTNNALYYLSVAPGQCYLISFCIGRKRPMSAAYTTGDRLHSVPPAYLSCTHH